MDGAHDPPRLREADLVADELEDPDRPLGLAQRLRAPLLFVAVELHEQPAQPRLGAKAMVARGFGGRDCAGEHPVGLGELAEVHQRLAQVGEQAHPVGVELGHEVDRAPQETGRRMHVATGERALAGTGQPLAGSAPEFLAMVVERAELGQVGVSLLEVVGRDLGVLGRTFAVHAIGPGDEALVHLRTGALQQAAVHGVADEDVLELVGVRDRPSPPSASG